MVILLEHKDQRRANRGSIAFVVGISKEGKFYGLHERWRPFVYLSKICFFLFLFLGGRGLIRWAGNDPSTGSCPATANCKPSLLGPKPLLETRLSPYAKL